MIDVEAERRKVYIVLSGAVSIAASTRAIDATEILATDLPRAVDALHKKRTEALSDEVGDSRAAKERRVYELGLQIAEAT